MVVTENYNHKCLWLVYIVLIFINSFLKLFTLLKSVLYLYNIQPLSSTGGNTAAGIAVL